MVLSLDDIQLPDEDKDKPAEINKDAANDDSASKASENSQPTPDKTGDDVKKDDSTNSGAFTPSNNTDNKDGSPEETKKEEAKDAATEDKKDPDKLPPFHENPDWQKMQEEHKKALERIAYLEGKSDANQSIHTLGEDEQKDLSLIKSDPYEAAREKLRNKLEGGWKPEDRVEERRVLDSFIDEAKKEQAEARDRQVVREEKRITNAFNEQLKASNLDGKYGDEVAGYLKTLQQQGLVIETSPEGIKRATAFAVEQLRSQNKLDKIQAEPAKPAETSKPEIKETNKDEQQKQKEMQDQVNGKIPRPASSTEKPTNDQAKPNYKYVHSTDLDRMVLDLGKTLN